LVVDLETISDDRGSMFLFIYKERDIKICEIKKGTARGGDIHPYAEQYDLVIHGKIELREKVGSEERKTIMFEKDLATIKRGVPHVLIALEDSLLLEWRNGPFDREIYEPYRKLCVD